MPRYLPPRTSPSAAIAVCDRCQRKKYLSELRPDGNSPGLRVCSKCYDVKDPWRLPARPVDRIHVQHPRPDVDVRVDDGLQIGTEYGVAIDFPPEIDV